MSVHPRVSLNPMATAASPMADAVELWRRLGAHTVGLYLVQAEAAGWDTTIGLIRAAGLRVEYVNFGVSCAVADDAGWRDTEARLREAVRAAAELGAPTLYFCTGPPGELRWEAAVELLGRRLRSLVADADAVGVTLALEHGVSSRPELGFLHTARDAFAAARHIGVGVCVDVYGCWLEPGLVDTLRDNLERVRLVQFSDFVVGTLVQPNRWVPGDGDLPLGRLVDDVVAAGYRGMFDLELLGPAIDAEGAAGALARGADWLGRQLQRHQL